jgi:hypothetical protein
MRLHQNVNETSLTPPLFIEVPAPSQENGWSCICVLRVSILHLSTTYMSEILVMV